MSGNLDERRRQAREFLAEHDDEVFPAELGRWVRVGDWDPPWTRQQLRSMRAEGLIEFDEPGKRYRLTLTATRFRSGADMTLRRAESPVGASADLGPCQETNQDAGASGWRNGR